MSWDRSGPARRARRLLRRAWWTVEAAAMAAFAAPFLLLPADVATRVFGALGRALLPVSPFARPIRENLALVRPELDWRAVSAGVGDNFARVIAEYVRLPAFAARRDRRRVAGIERLTEAIAAGRGAVIVTAHFGNWEAVRLAARDAGVDVGILYRAFNNPTFDRLAAWRIREAGQPVLRKNRMGFRGLLAHLKRGGAVMVLLDQRAGGEAALPFLGVEAETATAVAAFAARSGAALIPAVARRADDGLSFDVTFEAPIPPGDPVAMTREANARIGRWVDADPGQWFWLHRRWRMKRRPEAPHASGA